MKTWSAHWKGSIKPNKQRKYTYNLPEHLRGKLLSCHLSKPLRQKYGTRNIRLRKGDKVVITCGNYRGKNGIVERVDTKNIRVYITSIGQSKRDGSTALYPLHPSNLLIQELLTTDKRRFEQQKLEASKK